MTTTVSTQLLESARALADMIKAADSFVFFGGAGVSTESGVPDFRSHKGIYTNQPSAETMLTPSYMERHPESFWEFYRELFMSFDPKPNACHIALAELESLGKLSHVITQNVDGLHQAAGSRNVIELHGTGQRFYCRRRHNFTLEQVRAMPLVPICPECGSPLRPDIVLYEEPLNSDNIGRAIDAIAGTPLLIIGGTSLSVYPAAGLINYRQRSAKYVVINKTTTPGDHRADLVIYEPIGAVFAAAMLNFETGN